MNETPVEAAFAAEGPEVRILEPGTLIALVDPLCGWCWGAAPALEKIAATGLPLEIVCTGLFIGDRPMTEEFAEYAWQNDQRIALITGQIFSRVYHEKVLKNFDTKFDSGPATLAVTAVQMREPEKTLKALHAIQAARWVDGRDVTSEKVVAAVLRELGVTEPTIAAFLAEEEPVIEELNHRAGFARETMIRLEARGVPVLARVTTTGIDRLDSRWLFEEVDAIAIKLAGLPRYA